VSPLVLPLDPVDPDDATVTRAAEVLLRGGLVAFPTETVYGLGARALDPEAVAGIFAAKGRPSNNPVIVHVLGVDDALLLARDLSPLARKLLAAFWPGPLTVVVRRSKAVPDVVTAGGPTVALRSPSHPVARLLIEQSGPIAAPSANRSTELSPTTAAHVVESLGDRVDLVLDGGQCDRGIESTVVDATGDVPRILRPGSISRAEIAHVLGIDIEEGALVIEGEPTRSPGTLARHYAPRARLSVVPRDALGNRAAEERVGNLRVAILSCGAFSGADLSLPEDPVGFARELYGALHDLDHDVDVILVESPPEGDAWEAVHDRLRRASRRAEPEGER
jgi:L-threonylcarbamoyladenylate synthase